MKKLVMLALGSALLAGCSPGMLGAVLNLIDRTPGGAAQPSPSSTPQGIAVGEPNPATPCAQALIAVRWGNFPAEAAAERKKWEGHIRVDNGLVRLARRVQFEAGDQVVKTGLPSLLKWETETGPSFDGVMAVVMRAPTGPEPMIYIRSDVFDEQSYPFSALDGLHFRGSEDGHEFEFHAQLLPPRPEGCRDFDDPALTSDVADELTVEQNQAADAIELTYAQEVPATP